MKPHAAVPRTATRLFAIYALASLVPVVALGVVLALSYRHDANQRGLSEGQTEAGLLARTGVAPLLNGADLRKPLTAKETASLRWMSSSAIASGQVLRLRVRDLSGHIVFASDNVKDDDSADGHGVDPDALEAAHGEVVAEITHLDADDNPNGPQGPRAAEVYRPLFAGFPQRQVGVLEVYLPYAPIAHDVDSGLGMLYRDLAIGLAALYLLLALISASATRRLRGQVARNAYLAEHDSLTDLPNRSRFHALVNDAVDAGQGAPVVVAVIDLDRFKEVNDTLGHHNGDLLLCAISRRLRDTLPASDVVARLGGDEFGLVMSASAGDEDIEARLDDVRRLIEQEVEVSGVPLSVGASIGFAVSPGDGRAADILLQHADVAMYVAKGGPTSVVRYDAALDEYDAGKLSLVAELRRAITANELVLHYQPKADVRTGDVVALEALVRWNHPERGLVYPDDFIPIAEQTGIIDSLTRWVVQDAIGQLDRWGDVATGLAVAVNISARSISRVDFADTMLDLLAASQVGTDRILFEITETALVSDPERASINLARLTAAGIRISLDDFGSGQTSLGYLSTLPLHEVKIDKGFVMDMLTDRSHAAIVRSVIDLAHNLGFEVVAEGVETEGILAELGRQGCDIAQGYFLARPMPAGALTDWLVARRPVYA